MAIHFPTDRIVKTRLSLRELELDENRKKREDFLQALIYVKALPADNPDSFWSIASYHGMPYKKREVEPFVIPPNEQNNSAWNGYCQHANILFPTWHRFYCLKLEQSLQKALPDGDVMLPYWDETSPQNLEEGLPPLLYMPTVSIGGVDVPNPLLSFQLPEEIVVPPDDENSDANAKFYGKPKGYVTARYPFSGITNPPEAKAIADEHNQKLKSENVDTVKALKDNLCRWLTQGTDNYNSIVDEFKGCLDVTSYNKFSNTSSAGSEDCLEQGHNEIHLAVGGYTGADLKDDGSVELDSNGDPKHIGLNDGANGDMGENETAAFDPSFFMHHCNIDRLFWIWQKKTGNKSTIHLDPETEFGDAGLSNSGQGPTPYQTPGQKLGFQTELHPYTDPSNGKPLVSTQCFDVTKLGYDYSIGSLDQKVWPKSQKHEYITIEGKSWKDIEPKLHQAVDKSSAPAVVSFDSTSFEQAAPESKIVPAQYFASGGPISEPNVPATVSIGRGRFKLKTRLAVKSLSKNDVAGSFVVYAFYRKDGKLFFIGQRGVLNRWNRKVCKNCMSHPDTSVSFSVDSIIQCVSDIRNVVCYVVSKDPTTGQLIQKKIVQEGPASRSAMAATSSAGPNPTLHLITSYEQELLGLA